MRLEVGSKVTKNNIPKLIAAIEANADDCAQACANGIHDGAQSKAPVLTGRLRAGITVEKSGANSYVVSASSTAGGADREYAAYNEYGTRYMGAQPFMMPGFREAMASDVPAAITNYARVIERAAG